MAQWTCPFTLVTCAKQSISTFAICGEYAVSSPKMHVMPSELVLSRIDYANSLLFGAREADLKWLQCLQNKVAWLVFACWWDRCSVNLINSLHWLPVKDRICFKMMLHMYKCIMNVAPSYLCDLITLFSDSQTVENRPRLCSSSDTTKLLVPRSRKRAGDHSFVVATLSLWNELPIKLREAVSVPAFRRLLKTHLYKC